MAHNMAVMEWRFRLRLRPLGGRNPIPERQGSLRIDLPGERGCRATNWELTSTYLKQGEGESLSCGLRALESQGGGH